ncbi:MAG TPA: AI-2E family transporter [Bryobacteraceae bacterium]|nr:AI-2E family transporter [Bryobacteraceae bacterium]
MNVPLKPAKPPLEVEQFRSYAVPVIAAGVLIAVLYFGRVFFVTSLVAVIIAFILEPFVVLLMRARMPRTVASFLVCTVALLGLYLAAIGAYAQASVLLDELPKYGARIGELVEAVRQKVEGIEQRTYQIVMPPAMRRREIERQQQLEAQKQAAEQAKRKRRAAAEPPGPAAPPPIPEVRIHDERSPVTDYIYARLGSVYEILLMASFVPFLVYFMLSWRDHINRSFLQFFHGEDRMVAARSLQGIAEMARAFVVGNFLLGLMLAVFSSLAFFMIGLPYPLLVGPLSGFLSLVPYVGLPLAVIPPMFVALAAYNNISGYVLVFAIVSVFHLLALNLLYPKIVGSRVHLNPLVVTFSLMIWGFLWDAAGLLLAIPLTAGIKAVCDNVKGLRPLGKFLGD